MRPGFPGAALLSIGLATGFAVSRADETVQAPVPMAAESPAASGAARDPHDPTVPAGAVRAYIDACREGDYERAASRLDLSLLEPDERGAAGPRLARHLEIVLDQRLWLDFERLSEQPEGALDDGLPPDVERVGTVREAGEVEILLHRTTAGDGIRAWKFAPGTVARIPALYEQFGYGPIGELLPRRLFEIKFLGILLIQWIGLILLVAAALVVARIAVAALERAVRPFVARTRTDLDDRLLRRVKGPLRALAGLAVFSAGLYLLHVSEPVHVFLQSVLKGLTLLALTWVALRMVDLGAEVLEQRLARMDRAPAREIMTLGRRVVKALLLGLALIGVLQNLGFHVTGLVAGLGIGGLAVALAAQKSLENLFGGVTLIVDQPVRVGDFCRFGDGTSGTVEEVGLRTTRIRTLERTLVSVPNSQFAELQLENFAARDRIRLATVLGLRYETSADQLRFALAELRRVLLEHPRIARDALRVRFVGFGAHSLDLEIQAFVATTDFDEFSAVREELFLRFIEVVERAGTAFAFPSQTLYLGRDAGLDAGRSAAAEQAIRQRRDSGDRSGTLGDGPAERGRG